MRKCDLIKPAAALVCMLLVIFSVPQPSAADDLQQIKERGVLRHIGVPYANFVTGRGDGLDVEIMQRFAEHLGVKYEFVQSDWGHIFGDLTGDVVVPEGNQVEVTGRTDIRGDVIANGLTILPWREKVINYSTPTFPTQVWCVARADFPARPIASSGDIHKDIAAVKELIRGSSVMGKKGTCLVPGLYGIDSHLAEIVMFPGNLNDMAPAIIKGEADLALLDVADTLVALEKWPGKIKVLGPVSEEQLMGVGFRKKSPDLLAAFDDFLRRASGKRRIPEAG